MKNPKRWALIALMMSAFGNIAATESQAQVYGLPTPPSSAEPMPSLEDFRAMQQRLIAAEQRIDSLSQQQEQYISLPAPESDGAIEKRLKDLELKTSTPPKPPGTTFPNLKMSGFFHLDAGHFDQDPTNRANLGDIQDGVGFRRARLAASGNVTDFTSYFLEMDFGIAGRPSFTDVWGEQSNLPFFGNVRIGQFRQPLSMDSWTPIKQLEFLERSLPFQAFDPFRKVGIMAYDNSDDEMTTWAYSVFRSGGFNNQPLGDTRFATDIGDNGGVGVMGRATHLLSYDEPSDGRYLTHIGGGYSFSELTGSTGPNSNIYESRPVPEFFVGDPAGAPPNQTVNGTPQFPDTGRIGAQNYHVLNAQLAGQAGSFHWQSEYFGTFVNQNFGPVVYYDGYYVQAGYFLTGEHRTYNKKYGVFDKVVPFSDFFGTGRNGRICGWGAWEATSRLSYVNLFDPDAVPLPPFTAGPPVSPNPGRMYETTLGLNWFWNQYTTVQFDWMHCFLDTQGFGNSDLDIFAARLQVQF
jgi:phosphate-selective porin OprO/OprP